MRDPRRPITEATYRRILPVLMALVVVWILVDLWVGLPDLLRKVLLTVYLIGVPVVLTWPIRRAGVAARVDGAAHKARRDA